jgi:hypothetical protein
MAGTVRTTRTWHVPHLSLNSDGKSHPVLNVLSFFILIAGLLSFALGLFLRTGPSDLHPWAIAAAVIGLAVLLIGLVTQMMSATREQRIIIVTGIIAGFVGLALGLAHGGLG